MESAIEGRRTPVTALDWIVIALYAVAMLAVGNFYARRTKTSEEYLLGGRRMSPVAVGLSLFATLTSALAYLAVPGEMVQNGPMILAQIAAFPLIAVVVGRGLIPFIMRQDVTSAYEILERRFGISVRLAGSLTFLVLRFVWMAAILYAVSDKVLAPLLDLGPRATIAGSVVMCVITLIYTAEGGLKAVVATDAMQSIIMLLGAVTVIAVVCIDLGGFGAWWPQRWVAHWPEPQFGFSASERMTLGGIVLSTFAWYVCTCGSDQMAIQRWLATRDAAAARRSLYTTLLTQTMVAALLGIVGLAVVGYFAAHPELFADGADFTKNADRLFPRFIVVGLPPGITGLIIAAVLAAAMSSLSSGMNSSSAVMVEDFIRRFRSSPLTETDSVRLARCISAGVGVVAILLSLLMGQIDGNLLDVCYKAVNLLTAPLFVLFFLAMFVPWATSFGALAAGAASVLTAVGIAFCDALGLPSISILWIMPGSFVVGAVVGTAASLLPVGPRSKIQPCLEQKGYAHE